MRNIIQQKAFIRELIYEDLLDNAIGWIQNHLNPEDVFNYEDLSNWAEAHGYKYVGKAE